VDPWGQGQWAPRHLRCRSALYSNSGGPKRLAKAGVLALTRTLAVEWAPFGVRVNAVAPGPVRTEGTDHQLWVSPAVVDAVQKGVPLRRFGTAEEIAESVRFLVSPRASYITGQVLAVDGGQWLGSGVMDLLETALPKTGSPSPPGG